MHTEPRQLLFTSFFFWKNGSTLQKSINGLKRSLLHDILTACPQLAPATFPLQSPRILEHVSSGYLHTAFELLDEDIQTAFESLMHCRDLYKSYRLYFFLDTLDEYEGTHQQDYTDLVQLLTTWVSESRGAVKMCVSSRHISVFEDSFSSKQRIQLQDLTRQDIETYASKRLQGMLDRNPKRHFQITKQDLKRLVEDIVNRSGGIFLWVALVVKALRECIAECQSLGAFEKELASLPTELNDLFDRLLSSIRVSSQTTAYQIFIMISELAKYEAKMPLLPCLFLEEYSKDPRFASRRKTRVASTVRLKENDMRQARGRLLEEATRRVQGWSRGLVEVAKSPSKFYGADDVQSAESKWVVFAHRSVPDYLDRKAAAQMSAVKANFNPADALVQVVLAGIQTVGRSFLTPWSWGEIIYAIMKMQLQRDSTRTDHDTLIFLEIAAKNNLRGDPSQLYQDYRVVRVQEIDRACYTNRYDRRGAVALFSNDPLVSPLYLMAWLGGGAYVKYRLKEGEALEKDGIDKHLLLCCLFHGISSKGFEQELEMLVDCVQYILDHGVLEPISHVWLQFIIDYIESMTLLPQDLTRARVVGRTVALVLNYRRYAHLASILVNHNAVNRPCVHSKSRGKGRLKIYSRSIKHIQHFVRGYYGPAVDFVLSRETQEVTLRELVEFWNFDNKDEIIGLIAAAVQTGNKDSEIITLCDKTQLEAPLAVLHADFNPAVDEVAAHSPQERQESLSHHEFSAAPLRSHFYHGPYQNYQRVLTELAFIGKLILCHVVNLQLKFA